MNQEIKQLQDQVAELMKWKNERMNQQLTYPLDKATKDIIAKDFLRYVGNLDYTSSSGQVFPNLVVVHDNKQEVFSVYPPLYSFTADASTDVVTFQYLPFVNGDELSLLSDGTLPGGLSDTTPVFVISTSGNTCKFSLTSGGAAINITSAGTGIHYAYFFN